MLKLVDFIIFVPYKFIFRNWVWIQTSRPFSNVKTISRRKDFANWYWEKVYMPVHMKYCKEFIKKYDKNTPAKTI